VRAASTSLYCALAARCIRVWDPAWDAYFTEERDGQIEEKYYRLVATLLADTTTSDIRRELSGR
jgi:hypothetical protein